MVDLLPTQDQDEVIAQTRAYLERRLPAHRLFRDKPAGAVLERDIWPELAGLGWFGITLPEEAGGVGWGLAEEMLVFRELGRFLVSPAVLATALAARVAWTAGDAPTARMLVEGTAKAAAVIGGDADLRAIDADGADWLLRWDARGALLLPRDAAGELERRPATDHAVSLHRVGAWPRTRAQRALAIDTAQHPGLRIDLLANVLCAAMLVGIAEACGDMAADHARTRVQFGRTIGEFQAVKHACADMRVRSEVAFWQVVVAALQEPGDTHAASQVACAKVLAADAAIRNAEAAIQLHGGMGFTAELGVDAFLRRAHLLHHLGGDTRQQRAALLATPLL